MKRLSIILICALLALLFLASCSSGAPYAYESAPAPSSPAAPAPGMIQPAPAPAFPGDSASAPGADESTGVLPILTPADADGRRMIYTLTLHLQTTDFMAGNRIIRQKVAEMGGYVENTDFRGRDIRTPEIERSADYRFRLPSARLSEFIIVMEDNFNLLRLEQTTDDVTTSYRSADSQLEDLLETEQRLMADIANSRSASERSLLEESLREVRRLIRELRMSQTSVDESVVLSTVIINLSEVILLREEYEEPPIPLTFSERLSNRVSGSIDAFVSFCQGLLLAIIAIAPVLVVLIIIAAITVPIVRVIKKRKKKIKSDDVIMHEYPPYDEHQK